MYFLFFCRTICKSKFSLAFKTQATFKVAVKLQVVGHPAGNAAFVVGKAAKRDFNHFPAFAVSFSFRCNFVNVQLLDLWMLANGSSTDTLKVFVMMGSCIPSHLARHLARSRLLTLPRVRAAEHAKITEVSCL